MTELPYMKLWISEHLAATAHLEPAEMGAYDRLLFIMWQHGGWLPNNPKLLARYCRMTVKQWERVAPIVMEFFEAIDLDEGPIIQSPRLRQELNDARRISEMRSAISKRKSRNRLNGRGANAEQKQTYTESDTDSDSKRHSRGRGDW